MVTLTVNFKNKKTSAFFAIIFCTCLIGTYMLGTSATGVTQSFTISSGVYPQATYTVYTNGTYWFSKNEYGYNVYQGTSLTTVLQNTLDSQSCIDVYLDWNGTQYITGITLSKGNQYIHGIMQSSTPTRGTNLKLTPGANNHLITIDPSVNHDYYKVSDLRIDGDLSNTKDGVHVNYGAFHVELENIQAYNFGGSGFFCDTGSLYYLKNCYAQDCGGRGFTLQNWFYRNFVDDCRAVYNPTNVFIWNCNNTQFNTLCCLNSTTYSGITIQGGGYNNFFGLYAESNWLNGIYLQGTQNNNFYGTISKDNGIFAADNFAGVYLGSDSGTHSTGNNFIGGQIYSTITNQQHYAVVEIDANQDWNYYDGLRMQGDYSGLVINGVNSIDGPGNRGT